MTDPTTPAGSPAAASASAAAPPAASPPLSELTTLRVGGAARELVQPDSELEIVRTALDVWSTGDDWWVLGGGSNVVAPDDGLDGTVIRLATHGVKRLEGDDPARVHLRVQAGEPWDALVGLTVYNGWSGIEALSGIPGSVGAAPIQNIGAYGQELSQVLIAVDFLDWETGHRLRLTADELGLGYRTSAIKRGRLGIVIAVELELTATTDRVPLSRPVAYAQLADALGVQVGEAAPIREVREAVLRLRAGKGMVLDAADADSVSAGSFFTNPIVEESVARTLPADLPRWPVEQDDDTPLVLPLGYEPAPRPRDTRPRHVKLSAAWLIERAGIHRGFALPGSHAAISSKHTLALTNRGGATALEIEQLAEFVRTRVASEFGVVLQPEPVFLGPSDDLY
ncbi:UDP-N-acetylmuramate dehydrogenase [Schumannella luteola]|uniref:UDP-N-acetylenolpyruvoylglucosamine reductase n=1 Tax=Schumannella luteola TaxID=472059 RepID=A0A852YB17_9MICO|nr:UDP-N-acetylmuramate dehydrogenase [Schumannella luteola]TPX01229.1 UDP-N-acetylmuramate dehydrogenase [Schumannella luteola]